MNLTRSSAYVDEDRHLLSETIPVVQGYFSLFWGIILVFMNIQRRQNPSIQHVLGAGVCVAGYLSLF